MAEIETKFASQLVKGQVIESIEVDRHNVSIKLLGGGYIDVRTDGPEGSRLATKLGIKSEWEVTN